MPRGTAELAQSWLACSGATEQTVGAAVYSEARAHTAYTGPQPWQAWQPSLRTERPDRGPYEPGAATSHGARTATSSRHSRRMRVPRCRRRCDSYMCVLCMRAGREVARGAAGK